MIERLQILLNAQLDMMLDQLANECETKIPGPLGSQAAHEARAIARKMRGVVTTVGISGADVAARMADQMRLSGNADAIKRMDALVRLIDQAGKNRLVGYGLMGGNVNQIVAAAGKQGAKLIGIEDPRSNDKVVIADLRGGR